MAAKNIRRHILTTMLAAALAISVLPAAAATLPDPGASVPGATGGLLANLDATGDGLVRVLAGAFDPLHDPAPSLPGIGTIDPSGLDPAVPDYFLVQVAEQRYAATLQQIDDAGALRAGYLPDDTYVVRATPAQMTSIAASTAVRWAGYYQPAWRIPVAAGGKLGLLDLPGERLYRVYLFRVESDPAAVADALRAIDGVEVVSSSDRVVEVRGTAASVAAMASVRGVEWIGADREIVLMNANARWANDTGVRDTYRATTFLTGAGQTAAVADTGLNYTYDLNGRAHVAFRDCDADGTNCIEARYTMLSPGETSANAIESVVATGTDHRKMVAYFDIGGSGPQPFDTSSHGSHTAGSVDGDRFDNGTPDGDDGMAPGAMHVHQNISTLTGGLQLPDDDYDLWRQAYRPRDPGSVPDSSPAEGNGLADEAAYRPLEDARTHNNSYGLLAPVADDGSAMDIDRFVWDHEDMVIVVSAGNGGPDVFSVNSPAVAKNDFTSGAHANGRQPMASIDSMASFSSHGPTGDGRFGVDLATPGQIVVSVKGGTEDGYHVAQGTSMSAPILTGLATLVRQYFFDGFGPADGSGIAAGAPDATRSHNPSAALVKATMVNGAERMLGFYTGDDGSVRAQDGQWPSAGQGWGRVNLDNSLFFAGDTTTNWFLDTWRHDADAFAVGVGEERSYTFDVTDGAAPLDVTLAYTDAPNLLAAGTPTLVNDLDLELVAPSGTVFVGNNLTSRSNPAVAEASTVPGYAAPDTVNNLERVRVVDPETGTWTVRVRATRVAEGDQGFALAASGEIAEVGGGFVPGPGLFTDEPGAPAISNVAVEAFSGDTAVVTFDTDEATTATATVNGITYVDSYAVSDMYGLNEATSETSAAYADKPMLGTSHEILLTGLTHGESVTVDLSATDLGGNVAVTAVAHTNPGNVFQPDAPDIGQLVAASPPGWTTGTQLYAGYDGGDGLLGAWAFRIPDGVIDPAQVTGASVEFTSRHDWMVRYTQDPLLRVDLLGDTVESLWGTPAATYEVVDREPAVARAYPETTHLRGAGQTYSFAFSCTDLDALRASLADGMAAFRYDTSVIDGTGIFSADFGFNRRSNGPQWRPRLVLHTASDGLPGTSNCDPATPAPTISRVGVKPGEATGSVTVSWETDGASNSLVLFREQGASDWIQVGTPALTRVHQVQVFGLDPATDYEFAVRSEACNGATTTDVNGGAGYGFFVPVTTPPTLGNPVVEATYDFEASDQGWTASNANGTVVEWERTTPGHDGSGGEDLAGAAWWVRPYVDEMDVSLTSTPHLFGKDHGAVRYRIDHNTEDTFDFLYVDVSNDGGATWDTIDRVDGLSLGFEAREATFDAPDGTPVSIRFRFKSDQLVSSPAYSHVAVDDVEFVAYDVLDPGSTGTPTPTSGPAPAPSAGGSGITVPPTRSGPASDADLAAGTAWCDIPAAQPSRAVAGRVHGSGHWERGTDDKHDKVDFSFDAKVKKEGELDGKLKLHDKDLDVKIDAKEITWLGDGAGFDCNGVILDGATSFVFTARGEFAVDKAKSDAEFLACGQDNGKGKDAPPDLLWVGCTAGCDYTTGERADDDAIDGGNIHLHDAIVSDAPAAAGPAAGDAPAASAEGEAMVVELDPALLTVAPAGALLPLTAIVEGASGPLAGVTVTVRWASDSGTAGFVSTPTDVLGVAVVTVTVPPGDTTYTAWVGDLDSNPIRITALL